MNEKYYEIAQEATLSSSVPTVVKPFAVVRKRRPATLTGAVKTLKRYKTRMANRFSPQFSPPSPAKM